MASATVATAEPDTATGTIEAASTATSVPELSADAIAEPSFEEPAVPVVEPSPEPELPVEHVVRGRARGCRRRDGRVPAGDGGAGG